MSIRDKLIAKKMSGDTITVYLIVSSAKMRNIDGDFMGDSFVIERAFLDEKEAKKVLRRYQNDKEGNPDNAMFDIAEVDLE